MEISYPAAVGLYWVAIILYGIATALGTFDSVSQFAKNLAAYRYWGRQDNEWNRIQTRGDFRRSAWFLTAFLVAFLIAVYSFARLFIEGPPASMEASLGYSLLTYTLIGSFFCFWRAKHADRRTNAALDHYVKDHPEIATSNGAGDDRLVCERLEASEKERRRLQKKLDKASEALKRSQEEE